LELKTAAAKERTAGRFARVAHLQLQKTKAMQATAASQRKQREAALRFKFASVLARHLAVASRSVTADTKRIITKLARNGKLRSGPIVFPDSFWPPLKQGLRDITVGKRPLGQHIFCSERFSWVLYKDRRPQEIRDVHANPKEALTNVMEATLPLYDVVLPRYPAADHLQDAEGIADLAYVRAVWAYSYMLGREIFPWGLHEWPVDLPTLFGPGFDTDQAADGDPAADSAQVAAAAASSSSAPAPPAAPLRRKLLAKPIGWDDPVLAERRQKDAAATKAAGHMAATGLAGATAASGAATAGSAPPPPAAKMHTATTAAPFLAAAAVRAPAPPAAK